MYELLQIKNLTLTNQDEILNKYFFIYCFAAGKLSKISSSKIRLLFGGITFP